MISNLVTACIRTMRAILFAIQRESSLYGLFLNISKTYQYFTRVRQNW